MKRSDYKPVVVGEQFGRLTTVRKLYKNQFGHQYWLCSCECGESSEVLYSQLRGGKTRSCGCLRFDFTGSTTHGQVKTREYTSWAHMKSRCYRSNDDAYDRYGGRGIKVCDRWRDSFEHFIADMGKCPEGLSLGRIHNDKDYCPDNCRWETFIQQANNKRNNRMVVHSGITKTVAEWSRASGLSSALLIYRLNAGWPTERLLIPASQ